MNAATIILAAVVAATVAAFETSMIAGSPSSFLDHFHYCNLVDVAVFLFSE